MRSSRGSGSTHHVAPASMKGRTTSEARLDFLPPVEPPQIRLPFPQAGHDLKTFVNTLCAHLQIHCLSDFAESSVILGCTHAHSENQPSLGKLVDRHAFPGEFPGPPSRDR